jgi:hypothetical protein
MDTVIGAAKTTSAKGQTVRLMSISPFVNSEVRRNGCSALP